MIDLELERRDFKKTWMVLGGHFKYLVVGENQAYHLTNNAPNLTPSEKELTLSAVNTAWAMWLIQARAKQAEIDSLKACRSDFEIIQQTIDLVDLLATSTNVYQRDPSCLYPFESENPRVKEWWRTACKIQDLLTNTDPENCDFDEYKKMIEAAQENSHE